MADGKKSGGVVEDIWMNTRAGLDDHAQHDRRDNRNNRGSKTPGGSGGHGDLGNPGGHRHPGNVSHSGPSKWDEIENDNILLNPDESGIDRG